MEIAHLFLLLSRCGGKTDLGHDSDKVIHVLPQLHTQC